MQHSSMIVKDKLFTYKLLLCMFSHYMD